MSMVDITQDEIDLMTYTALVRELEWQELYKLSDDRYTEIYNQNIELLKKEIYKRDNY